jgi:hypothetical protein
MTLDPRDSDEDRRGRTLKDFAERHGVSKSLIQRAVSHGLIKVLRFGDRPIIPAEEHQRICREGLPRIPAGYRRTTKGPWPGGRPRANKSRAAATKTGKPVPPAGKVPPRRTKRGEDRATT